MVLETGKSDAKVRSTHKGVITSFLFKEGDVVKIGEPLFEVDTEGKATAGSSSAPKDAPKAADAAKQAQAPKHDDQAKHQAAAAQPKTAEKSGKSHLLSEAPKPKASEPAPAGGKAVQGDSIRFSKHLSQQPKPFTRDRRLDRR